MLFFKAVFSLVLATVHATPTSGSALIKRDIQTFDERVIYTPGPEFTAQKTLYARSATLKDGSMLLTWENYSPEPPAVFFPIYKSIDNGSSWQPFSKVTDQKNGWGLRYQPYLYVLPETWAGFPAGTVLCAGNSIPTDLSKTRIDLYASVDGGLTWTFLSNISSGGRAIAVNGESPVWEPFLLLHKGTLLAYYSDQANPRYGQKLVHRRSTDGKRWSTFVNDMAAPVYSERPGMTTVAALPNGKFIMTFEYGRGNPFRYPIYFKIADDPSKFGYAKAIPIVATDGTVPDGNPVVTWSPAGGVNGTILVTAGGNDVIFTNTALGDRSQWKTLAVPHRAGYTREVRAIDDTGYVMLTSGGPLFGNPNNQVTNAVIRI